MKITKECLRRQARIAIRTASDGQLYFVVLGGNGEPMGTSETYPRFSGAKAAAARFKLRVAEAEIEDERGE